MKFRKLNVVVWTCVLIGLSGCNLPEQPVINPDSSSVEQDDDDTKILGFNSTCKKTKTEYPCVANHSGWKLYTSKSSARALKKCPNLHPKEQDTPCMVTDPVTGPWKYVVFIDEDRLKK